MINIRLNLYSGVKSSLSLSCLLRFEVQFQDSTSTDSKPSSSTLEGVSSESDLLRSSTESGFSG